MGPVTTDNLAFLAHKCYTQPMLVWR